MCAKCDCSFKKGRTLKKHTNTRHAEQNTSNSKERGKGQFGCVLKVIQIIEEVAEGKKSLSDIAKDSEEQKEVIGQTRKEYQSIEKENNEEKGMKEKEEQTV